MRLFNHHSESIASGAMIIAFASLASRVLGVFRDRILASEFGAGDVLDAYFTAFRVPDTLFNLLVLGAISAGFIPVFLKCLDEEGKVNSWKMVNSLLNILLSFLFGIGVLLWFITPQMMDLVAPGFPPEKYAMTVTLTRIMLFSPILFAASSIFGGVLQSLRQFFIYSIAPVLYNGGIIIGALYLVPFLGVYGLALGVLFGAFFHMFIQYIAVRNEGYRYIYLFNFMDKHVREILRLMLPRTMALAVNQVNLFVVTVFGSFLSAGSIAVYNLANNLQAFPLGVFAISLAVAAFPSLSEAMLKKDKSDFISHFSGTAKQILFFLLPSSALLIVLRAQIVRVLLGAGFFDWRDTIYTADALAFFSLSLFAQGLIPLLARAFYASHDTKTPFYIGVSSVVLNIVLSYFFVTSQWILNQFSGVVGLVMAFSISQIFQCLLLWISLRFKVRSLGEFGIIRSVFKTSLATFALGISAHLTKFIVEPYTGTKNFLGIFSQGMFSAIVGVGFFVLISMILRSEELASLIAAIKRRLFRVATPVRESIEEAER
jgi:putative peptidoglycan lipid II flippase